MQPQNQKPDNQPEPAMNPQPPGQTNSPVPGPTGPAGTPKVFGPQQFSAQPYIGTPDPLPPRKRRWPKILIIAVLVLVLAGSGGGYAYWTILNNRPEKVLADAVSNTMTELLERKPTAVVSNLVYEDMGGDGDDPFKLVMDFDLEQIDDDYETAAKLRFESGEIDISVEGALIIIDTKELYVKFDNLQKTAQDLAAAYPDAEPWIAALQPIIQKIDGKWIKIDSQSTTEAGLTESEHQIDVCSNAFKNLRLSPDDQKNVKDIFSRNQFAIATEKLPEETASDEESFHYKLDLNEEASIRFTKELVEIRSFEKVKKECEIKQSDLDRQLENLEEQQDSGDEVNPVIELWVGTETRLPTRLRVTADDKEFTSTFDATVDIDAADVRIETPSDALSLTEVIQDFEDLEVLGTSIEKAIE